MISTHILDTSLGHPASGVTVQLEKKVGETWSPLSKAETNADGRIAFQTPPTAGTYRLLFETEAYFKKHQTVAFFPSVPVIFQITDTGRKYHVPLLLNPYGYSTYRGS